MNQIDEYIELYLTSLKVQNYSSSTMNQRHRNLRHFLQWVHDMGFYSLEEVTLVDLQSHFLELAEQGKSASHRIVRTSVVKSFFRLLYESDLLPQDPSYSLRYPKRGKTLPRGILDMDGILDLLSAPDISTPLGLRDKAILEVLYSCGIRNSELRVLSIEDLNLSECTLFIKGKGSKEGVVPFGKTAARSIADYLAHGRNKFIRGKSGGPVKKHKGSPETDYLFLSKNGYIINANNLTDMVKRYAKKLDLDFKYFGPHSLRHTCATHLLRGGADIRQIQKLLRHARLDTTQIYTHVLVEDLQETQRKYHPRELMCKEVESVC